MNEARSCAGIARSGLSCANTLRSRMGKMTMQSSLYGRLVNVRGMDCILGEDLTRKPCQILVRGTTVCSTVPIHI